ncbi:uncharacterized protein ACR2FA_010027 [Aphomia sociella]
MPIYLKNFHYPLKEIGFWMSLFFTVWLIVEVLNVIASCIYNNLVRLNIGLEYLVDVPSKIIFTFGFICIISALPVLSYLIPNWTRTAIIVLAAIIASLSLQSHVLMKSVMKVRDLDQGTVLMLSGTFASLVGAFVPLLTGFIINDNMTNVDRWRYLFYVLMSIVLTCQILYFMLRSDCILSWKRRLEENRTHHLIGYDNSSELFEMKSGHC